MATAIADNRRFTRAEYEQLIEQGYFHPGEKVELIDGILYEMSPQGRGRRPIPWEPCPHISGGL